MYDVGQLELDDTTDSLSSRLSVIYSLIPDYSCFSVFFRLIRRSPRLLQAARQVLATPVVVPLLSGKKIDEGNHVSKGSGNQ